MTNRARAGGCAGFNYPFLTSKERDNETELDYFGARYYSSKHGRFTSPDEFTGGPEELFMFAKAASANPTFYADLGNPQSLNKYQYSYNNPLRYVDPDGHQGQDEIANRVARIAAAANAAAKVKQAVDRAIKTAKATVNGASSAWAEDNLLGPNSGPQNKVGRAAGHVVALGQAALEILVGLQAAGGGGAAAVLTSPAPATGVGTAAPAASIAVAIGGVATGIHGALVGANTLNNIFNKNAHPDKDDTLEGAVDDFADIEANQANKRKVDLGDDIYSTDGTKQVLDTELKKIKTYKDSLPEKP